MNSIGVALTHALIVGAINKEFTREKAIIMAVDYLYKGALSENQVTQIIDALPCASQNG